MCVLSPVRSFSHSPLISHLIAVESPSPSSPVSRGNELILIPPARWRIVDALGLQIDPPGGSFLLLLLRLPKALLLHGDSYFGASDIIPGAAEREREAEA